MPNYSFGQSGPFCCCPTCNTCQAVVANCPTDCVNICGNNGGWSDVANCSSCVLLPVELTEFKVEIKNDHEASLTWKTASETNNMGFEVQRANFNEINWETIGFKEGSGDSYELVSYNFVDNAPIFGINYYRLKQIDYDGNFEYSKVISFDIRNKGTSLKVANTVVKDYLFLNYESQSVSIQNGFVSDMFGRKIMDIKSGEDNLNLTSLQAGQYIISIQLNNGKIFTDKFIKIN